MVAIANNGRSETNRRASTHRTMAQSVNNSASSAESNTQDDSEPRDTGSFKATFPELGGFLTEDGTPYHVVQRENSAQRPAESSDVRVPYDLSDEMSFRRWILTIVVTLLIVSVVAAVLVSALLFSLGSDAVGSSGDLINVLRSSVL